MGIHQGGTPERPALFFDGPVDFDAWLAGHHATEPSLWVGLYKKHAAARGLTYADAVPAALRWGWIDSTTQGLDADSVRQRFSPRRPGSAWSRTNIDLVRGMIADGTIQPAGLAAFERRVDETTPAYAYQMGEAGLAPEHEALLRADAAAAAYWDAAAPSYRRMVSSWIARAKRAETRDRRAAQLVAACAEGRPVASLTNTPATRRNA